MEYNLTHSETDHITLPYLADETMVHELVESAFEKGNG